MPTEEPTQHEQNDLFGAHDTVKPRRRRRRPDGLTAEERDRPFTDYPVLREMESASAAGKPDQLPLFMSAQNGEFSALLGGLPVLTPESSLELARAWYRRELEQTRRPHNTIESYSYDLAKLEERIGHVPIAKIRQSDIANYLGLTDNKSTRKRRLTSVRRFFTYLIQTAKVIQVDPTDGFYPHSIQLRSPIPLFEVEQDALLAAAASDEHWSLTAIWLMLRLGLSRSELLALRREHIDLADPEQPVVFIFYDDVTKRGKERKLAGDSEFARIYAEFVERKAPVDLLFSVGFQAVNVMVERVRRAAGLAKEVSPQVLRHTFAVDRAKTGAGEEQLLALLGLADDPRNRGSVRRYLKLAEPPL